MQYSTEILPLLGLILFFGLLVPSFFKWFQLPFATSLIWTGLIVGPSGLSYVEPNDTLRLFAFIGANFLMLLAGFESTDYKSQILNKKGLFLTIFSGILPAIVGVLLTRALGYPWLSSLFVAAMFFTSSILITYSTIDRLDLENTKIGELIKPLVAFQDLTGALIAFLIFKYIEPHSRYSLPILLGLLISLVIVLRLFLSEIVTYFFQKFSEKSGNENRLRLIISILLLVTFLFSALDVPSIISSFLVGYCLSSIPNIEDIREKLKTIGHGFFIPIFLFLVGLDLNFSFIKEIKNANMILILIVSTAILSKVLLGALGSKIVGNSTRDSWLFGVITSTKLTVPVSVSYVAFQMKIIDDAIFTSLITITAISTLLMPPLTSLLSKRWKKSQ